MHIVPVRYLTGYLPSLDFTLRLMNNSFSLGQFSKQIRTLINSHSLDNLISSWTTLPTHVTLSSHHDCDSGVIFQLFYCVISYLLDPGRLLGSCSFSVGGSFGHLKVI